MNSMIAAGLLAVTLPLSPVPDTAPQSNLPASAPHTIQSIARAEADPTTSREVCFSSGERTDGLNKICYYRCPSGEVAITIRSTSLCPLNINR